MARWDIRRFGRLMFAGIIGRGGAPVPAQKALEQTLLARLQPRRPADLSWTWRNQGALLVQALHRNLPNDPKGNRPFKCPDSGRVIIGWIRLDNGCELRTRLNCREDLPDAEIVLMAFGEWGDRACAFLRGDFAFLIYDPETRMALCARDPFGVRPFYWYADQNRVVVSSTAAIFPSLDLNNVGPDDRWIGEFLIGYQADVRRSAFTNVHRLAPGHMLSLNGDGEIRETRSQRFEDNAPFSKRPSKEAVDRYRAEFTNAVAMRCRSAYDIGSENSGGLDSSTITASAISALSKSEREVCGFGFAIAEHEKRLIDENTRHCGLQHSIVYDAMADHTDELSRLTIECLGYPSEHANAQMHWDFYRECERREIRTLLSGFGGDEIVTSQAFRLNRELWSKRAFIPLLRNISSPRADILPQLRELTRWLRGSEPIAPQLQRLFEWRWSHSVLARHWREDAALRELNESRAHSDVSDTVNGQILNYGMRPYVQSRLEGCSLIAQAFGVEYRWPLLDQQLVQTYLDTPSIEKSTGLTGRWLHRRATKGLVPDSINQQRSKSMGSVPLQAIPSYGRSLGAFMEKLNPATFDHVDRTRLVNLERARSSAPQNQERRFTRFYIDTLNRVAQLSHWLDFNQN
ncbi:asparagine synthetase B family protein [Aurantiacibacter sediminis]|uniref:asparagine synthetase B family protein n=1 Tax=Aurantiacibacter sediminis TaxID=2793064 RepID=UPI001F2E2E27|nr:asparagine synthase-related protein [Aurantiacibacter sediminis]